MQRKFSVIEFQLVFQNSIASDIILIHAFLDNLMNNTFNQ
jgi:hypothetical protein